MLLCAAVFFSNVIHYYLIKYAHDFVVPYFVAFILDDNFNMDKSIVCTHILQGCFSGTGAII